MDKTVLLLLCLQVVLLIAAFPSDAAGQVVVKGPDQVKRSATAIKKVGVHTFNYLSEFTTNSILYFVERGTAAEEKARCFRLYQQTWITWLANVFDFECISTFPLQNWNVAS